VLLVRMVQAAQDLQDTKVERQIRPIKPRIAGANAESYCSPADRSKPRPIAYLLGGTQLLVRRFRVRPPACYRPARRSPASATVSSPVMFLDAGLARNMTTSARSSAVEATRKGTMPRMVSRS
jgi:hypothetical protein